MSTIKILPPQIANKIAAGEVVDRPAAVVKELIENAIDADATEIKIVLEQAGKNLIQVVDNGSGMGAEDLPLAFQRHATSKIEKVADLDKILTLGFRGEALPSIASVARIEIKSCLSGENLGTEMQLENGKIIRQEKIALKSGTTVTVRNLFYNTPARRNFLRSDVTELNHINRVLKRFFLGYPEIRFDVLHNDKEIYQLQQTNIEQRLTAVLGEELYDGMVFVREDLNDIFLEGYACRPDLARGNSENQFIFLNKRAIQNRGLNHAVLQGYGNLIERSQYPQFIIFLNTPPNFVDINVHPTKMEVRFSNERAIYHMFLSAVRKAIQTENVIPSFSLNKLDNQKKEIERKFKPRNIPFTRQLKPLNNFEENESLENQLTFSYTIPSSENEDDEDYQATSSDNLDDSVEQPGLWQMHRRYICSQIKSGLVIIDQHVAHERVLYEKFLGYLNEKRSVPSQKLLFPQTLELSLEDFLIFGEIKEWVQKIGFSCKNAIKSGDKLTQKEMIALVDQLFATKEPYFCPHGRPVIVTLNLEEIDRKFKRI
ncbi:MAG: DNA mismatch repair endonuclease MutL [Calditrichota bacterium]